MTNVYAPWVNSITLGGVIWKPPILRSVQFKDKEKGETREAHFLGMFLMSWRAKHEQMRKVAIAVDHTVMAEYWHSVLRKGDPVVVTGELRTRSYETNDGRKAVEQKIISYTIVRLHKPPERWNPSQDVDNEE